MSFRGKFVLLLILALISLGLTGPVPESQQTKHIHKRDGSAALMYPGLNPLLPPYGIYPGIKPLRPFIISDLLLNRFATPPPPPIATFFKNKKDEFLNKLFDDLTAVTDAPSLEVRSIVDSTSDEVTDAPVTTPKPKIDPSVFISKKFDFLAQLFKTLNTTTTPAPTVEGETIDPTATTLKPTIVPPGFWVPFPLPPKPPKAPKPSKAPKPPKPAKSKTLLLNAVDEALLKTLLSGLDPTNTLAEDASVRVARKPSFLDELLHRVTTPPPIETTPETPPIVLDNADANLKARSLYPPGLYPPGFWIPPYIYAAKMGIYLDKIFDTLNAAAATTDAVEQDYSLKRSIAPGADASAAILAELGNLKNNIVTAFEEAAKAKAKVDPSGKKPAFKKPFWGPKPTPDPVQEKVALLSDVFDKLAEVEQLLLSGQVNATEKCTMDKCPMTATTASPSFWAPDPTTADISGFYKEKVQQFLTQLSADPAETDS